MKLSPYELQQIATNLKLTKEDFFELYKGGKFFAKTDNFKKFFLEGMSKVILDVWNSESDLYIINIGREGSGKSLFSIWASYYLSKELGSEFSIENIALNHTEWVALQDQLKKSFLIHDEAIETFSALEFQSTKGRSAMEIAVRNRVSQIINILNIPTLKYVHPYIREERLDMVWININLDVKDEFGNTKRVYMKFILDKENALKMVEYINKKHSLTKSELIGRAKNGKRIFNFNFGGVFWIDLKNDTSMDIIQEYKIKKKTIANITNSINLIKDVMRQNLYYLVEYYKGSYSYILLLLFALLNKWVKLSIKELNHYYIEDANSLKIFLDLDFEEENTSKKKKQNMKDIRWFWLPKDFLDNLIDTRIFYDLVKIFIEDVKFRRVEKYSNIFYKIDLTTVSLLGNNKTYLQDIKWVDLNYIDKFILSSFYSRLLLKKNFSVNELFSFIKEIDNNPQHQEEINKILEFFKSCYHLLKENYEIIKKKDLSILEIYKRLWSNFDKRRKEYVPNLDNSSIIVKNLRLITAWRIY